MRLSIILTSYDRPLESIRMLETLQSSIPEDSEVIILNDNEIEDTQFKSSCEEYSFVKYIHTGVQKRGKKMWRVPGYALNIGFKNSTGTSLIIGNSEVLLPRTDLVKTMLVEVEKGNQCSPPVWCKSSKQWLICKYPFFLGVPRRSFEYIQGYDEDFIGYCFDDDDISYRLTTQSPFIELEESWCIYHIIDPHKRSGQDSFINRKMWEYNKSLFESRKPQIIRNTNKDWGVLDKEYQRNFLENVALR